MSAPPVPRPAARAPRSADALAAGVAALLGAPPPRAPRPPPRPPARVAPTGPAPQGPPRRRSGSLVCAGLLLPLPAWPPPAAGLRDLLCAWAPGDRLLALPPPGAPADGQPRAGGALLLRLGAARRVGPQALLDRLVEDGVGLSALDGEACPLPGGALWAEAGARRLCPLPAAALDPAALINLDGLALRAAPAVGRPAPLPAEEPPEPATRRAARLGLWSAEGQAAMAAAAAGATGSGGGPGPAAQSRLGALLAGLGGWLTRAALSARRPTPGQPPRAAEGALGSRFRSLPGWVQSSLSAVAGVGLGAAALIAGAVDATLGRALRALRGLGSGRPAAAPAGPGLWARLQGALSAFAPLWRVWSKLSGAQARYLNDLLRRFSDAASTNELLEALRHAIPLGGEAGGLERWLFGAAGPRTVGQLSAGGPRSSVDVSAEVMGLLRRLYLDAHARLDAEGDVERAAWVLAELLRDPPGAVAYLERKGALALAARYAEALDQPTATCLRLWVAAGEPARAARLGLLRGALGAAITALEGDHPAIAASLRRRHAAALLGLGDTRGAVAALWPLVGRGSPEERARAKADLRAILAAVEGLDLPESAWALAARLALDPPVGPAPEATAALQAALARGPLWRLRLAEGALATPPEGGALPDEPLLRALLRDLDGPTAGPAAAAITGLTARARGGAAAALRADLPPLPKPPAPRAALPWEGARRITVPAGAGGAPVLDLLPLDHGGVVVALGGLGQRALRPGARGPLLPTPAERLLAVPGGWLALSRAGRDLRVGRGSEHGPINELGLIPGAAGALARARSTADGLLLLPEGPELCAYLPEAASLRRLWRSGALPEAGSAWTIPAIDVEGNDLRAILESPTGERSLWRWDRSASFTLRERRPLRLEGRLRAPSTALLSGLKLYEGDGLHERLFVGPAEEFSRPSPAEPADLEALGGPPAPAFWVPIALFGELLLERGVEARGPAPPAVFRLRRLSGTTHRSLQLRGPITCAALATDHLWLASAEGDVWRVDLHEGALVWHQPAG